MHAQLDLCYTAVCCQDRDACMNGMGILAVAGTTRIGGKHPEAWDSLDTGRGGGTARPLSVLVARCSPGAGQCIRKAGSISSWTNLSSAPRNCLIESS